MKARTRLTGLAVTLALAFVLAGPSRAADAVPVGDWQGTLQGILRLVFHFHRGESGQLKGTMDSPDQGATGIRLASVVLEGDSLHFDVPSIRGLFAGRVASDGDSISGRWMQAGMSLPLVMRRGAADSTRRRPQEPAKPYPYDETEVRVENRGAGITLAGTLSTPRGAGRFPCAVLITGSGPEDRDETVFGHRPFLVLADHLTRQGIAVLRMDDRGVGASTGRFAGSTSADFADDIRAGVDFLARHERIDPKRIGLIGHSEGGVIAPLVSDQGARLAFMVLLAGPGLRGDSLLQLQSIALRRAAGLPDSLIARGAMYNRRLYERIIAGDSLGALEMVRALVREEIGQIPGDNRGATGDPERMASELLGTIYTPWMRFLLGYDASQGLARAKCPILAIWGDRDLQVPWRENREAMASALEKARHRDHTLRVVEGLNHMFQSCKTCTIGEYMQLEETMAPVVLAEISDWIQVRTRAKR